MVKKEKDSLKAIERLLERVLDELIVEIPEEFSKDMMMLPIPTKTFLEMEEEIGEEITFIALS